MRSLRFIPVLLLLFTTFTFAADGKSHQPMLAVVYEGELHVSDFWISEKLDGVRGHWDGKTLWSRGGNPIATPDWFTRGWPATAMDGELWIARGHFDEVSGIVRSTDADDAQWRRVKFMVFDLPAHGGSFDQRVEAMRAIRNYGIPWLQVIPQFRVSTIDELDKRLEEVVAAGGEGLMLHRGGALYRAGRSEDLLKYKPYEDAEARVVGYTEGKGKYSGKIGALVVEDREGRRFRLGSGLSDADREQPPAIGTWVTYRYNGLTANGLPRFARYLRPRGDMDEAIE